MWAGIEPTIFVLRTNALPLGYHIELSLAYALIIMNNRIPNILPRSVSMQKLYDKIKI